MCACGSIQDAGVLDRGDFHAEWDPSSARRPHPPDRQSLLDRRRAAHRPHASSGQGRRVPAPCRQRRAQRPRLSVCRRLRSRQDDDFKSGARRRRASDRRNLLRTEAGRRLFRLRHAVHRGTGQAGRKYQRADRCVVPAGARPGEPHRAGQQRRSDPGAPLQYPVFCRGCRIGAAWCFRPPANSSAACRFTGSRSYPMLECGR